MRGEDLKSNKRLLVFDTGALLSKIQLQMYSDNIEIYTTPSVLEEVKDRESREALEVSLNIDRVRIAQPSEATITYISKLADSLGYLNKLSRTDIEVASLAYELNKYSKVTVLTDDYDLQNLLLHLNIEFATVKTKGIREARILRNKCRVCGYPLKSNDEECHVCGSKSIG